MLKEEHVVRQSLLCWHVEFNIFNICCGVVLFNFCLWSAYTVMDVFVRCLHEKMHTAEGAGDLLGEGVP